VWRSLYKHGEGLKLIYIVSNQEELKLYHTCVYVGLGDGIRGGANSLWEVGQLNHGMGLE
jgi:hypothetical protein